MKRIDIYIIKKYLGTFFLSILLIITISVVVDISEKLDEFMDNKAPLNEIIFDYYLNFIPYFMNMKNKKWADDFSPIDPESDCFVDLQYSKAYLRHLFVSQELLAMQIASIHNLAFYLWLVKEARKHIIAGDFHTWKPMMLERVTRRL